MDGRLENELKIKGITEKKLSSMPNYVTEWYKNLLASGKTASTCREYINKVHKFLQFVSEDVSSVSLKDISPASLDSYFEYIKTTQKDGRVVETSGSLRQTTWIVLNSFFTFLRSRNYISVNYIDGITKPKNDDLARINDNRVLLTESDFKDILSAIKAKINYREDRSNIEIRDYAIVMLFMSTGMRETALGSIDIDDVDFETNSLRVIDKGDRYIRYTISEKLKGALEDWLELRKAYDCGNSNALFLTLKGNRLSPLDLANIVKKYTRLALGKELSPHKLRSGFITIMVNQTGNIALASKMVGHKNISTTQRYYATGGKEKDVAASIIDSIL